MGLNTLLGHLSKVGGCLERVCVDLGRVLLLTQALSEEREVEYQNTTLFQFAHSQYNQTAEDSSNFEVIFIKK